MHNYITRVRMYSDAVNNVKNYIVFLNSIIISGKYNKCGNTRNR